ncbi:MAG: D-glycero-alpha-D-manno-heptose-1,7-bisphosphate 7-phosphatase [bacterium]
MSSRAVFVDRDGTIIEELHYPDDPQKVRLLPGAGEALAELRKAGFLLVLVSTQSGVGRGLFAEEAVRLVHDRMMELLEPYGVALDDSRYCLHAPWDGCSCRKPSPRMLEEAARRLDIDTGASFMIGDKPEDVEAGARAGCRTILIAPVDKRPSSRVRPDVVSADWANIVGYIRSVETEVRSPARPTPP